MKRIIILFLTVILVLTGCGGTTSNISDSHDTIIDGSLDTTQNVTNNSYTTEGVTVNLKGNYSKKALEDEWNAKEAVIITASGTEATIEGTGADITALETGCTIEIHQSGTYVFRGELLNGQIIINSDKDKNVQIVMDGFKISNNQDAPVYVISAKNVYLTLVEGTTNTVLDERAEASDIETEGIETGTIAGEETSETEELTAAIYSKTDLIINGTGSLHISGGYKDGITSKDDLQIISGNINIEAADDGLVGKDSVSINDGELNLYTGGDGIKSSNKEDTQKGNVIIDGGTINIAAGDDGIDCIMVLAVNGGRINITESQEGFESQNIIINDGQISIKSSDDGMNITDGSGTANPGGFDRWKGMKQPEGSEFPEGKETLEGTEQSDWTERPEWSGQTERPERPDGTMNGKNTTNFEKPSMPDGEFSDGELPNGEFSNGEFSGFGGFGGMDTPIDGALVINGGNITVNASGDGLDSNGDIQMNGGSIIIYGPTNGGNGAIDYNGVCEINGGVLLVASFGGMEQSSSKESTQNMKIAKFNEMIKAGTTIKVCTSDKKVLYSFEAVKDCYYAAVSASELNDMESVLFIAGDMTQEVK